MNDLRLANQTERIEANDQATAAASLNDLAKQFLCPLIEQVVIETIARLEAARVEKVPADSPTLWRADWHRCGRKGQGILGAKGKG